MRQKQMVVMSLVVWLLGLTGCFEIPDNRVVWSPDSSRALVRMNDNQLFVLEGPELAPRDSGIKNAVAMDWLPDNRRAVVSIAREYTDWASLKNHLSAEQIEEVTQAAASLVDAIMAIEGAVTESALDELPKVKKNVSPAVLIQMRDTASTELQDKLGEHWDKLKEARTYVFDVVVLDIDSPERQTNLISVPADDDEPPLRPFVDPTGRTVALLLNRPEQYLSDGQPAFALAVCEMADPDSRLILDEQVGYELAWSRDGRRLAYFRYGGNPPGEDQEEMTRLGSVVIRDIPYDETGHLDRNQSAYSKEIGVLFQSFAGLQFAPDGCLYFATMDFRLPATEEEMPESWSIFRWDPDYPNFVYRVLDRDAERWFSKPHSISWTFALSPSGRRLQLLGEDGLYLRNFPSGGGPVLDIVHTDKHGIIPVWRNEDEITVVVEPGNKWGSPHRSELVLMKLNPGGFPESAQCLSRDWPDAWVSGWFEEKKPKAAPTPN